MVAVDFSIETHIGSQRSLAVDRFLLAGAAERAAFRVYDFAGDVLSLGRYHLAPMPPTSASVQLHRRFSGGRALPFGDGFIGVTLVLPHRSALVAAEPFALAPYQVPNRYVRGVMEGCRIAGLDPVYPGREFLTLRRRAFAHASFEVDANGALLFEVIIANSRDFSVLPQLLDQADPTGVVKAEMLAPETTTSLGQELGTQLTTEEVAELMRRGFEQHFGLTFEEGAHIVDARAHSDAGEWLNQRHPRADLPCYGFTRSQLGVLEIYGALAGDRIGEIMFAGDFIANSPAIARLERDLRLCPTERAAIDAVIGDVFAPPENFILGIGPTSTITDAICRGIAR